MNSKLLRSIMILHDDTNAKLSKFLGISEQSLSMKINESGSEFRQSEICKIKVRYGLTADQVNSIFFADEVANLETLEG